MPPEAETTPAPATDAPEAAAPEVTEAPEPKPSLVADAGDKTEPPAATPEPITADAITFPEGVTPDDAAMTGFLDLMNDTEISPTDRAQKLIDLQFTIAEEAGKASQALWDKTQDDWQAAARALPENGGDMLPETLANIKSGLDKLGATDETYAALNFTGAGNHPEIIQILSKATAHLVEGKPPKEGVIPSKGNLSQAARIYGSSNME